jgi:hypothetical protein
VGLARFVLLALVGVALVPSVLPFTVESAVNDRVCVPVFAGWHADRATPSDADAAELFASFTVLPTPEEMRDPVGRAAWLAEEEARTSTPGYRRAEAYVEWRGGAGACVPESRHRLIQSGAGLGAIGVVGCAGMVGGRRRKSVSKAAPSEHLNSARD